MNLEEKPLVSIIIPTYKRANMLDRAIKSVLNQTYSEIEIIIIDDNDENSQFRRQTEKHMEKYELNTKIRYIKHKKNQGGSCARNTGINQAQGLYISFLDDDDEYHLEKIEKQMQKILTNKLDNIAFVYCQMSIYDKDNGFIAQTKNFHKGKKVPFQENMIGCIAGTPTILVQKSVLQEIGGFKKLLSGQDWYLIIEILEKGYNIDYLEESLVKVNMHHEERISSSLSKIKSLKKEIFEIKRKYLHVLDEEYKNLVLYEHNMQLANHIKLFNKRRSLKNFKNALKYKKVNKKIFYT